MNAVLEPTLPNGSKRINEVPGWFWGWEERLSRFNSSNELSRLNRSAGMLIHVSEPVWDLLQHAVRIANRTGGMVTPTTLSALLAAGYDRSYDQLHLAAPGQLQDSRCGFVDAEEIWFSKQERKIRLPEGAAIDLGGFAKGWAADRAAERLSTYGPALIDAGGDIAVSGPRLDGEPWPIGIENPFVPELDVGLIMLERGGVATSGKNRRNWRVTDGGKNHHLIDTRTGLPAQTDVITATAIAPSALEAEVAAKMLFLLGSNAGLEWIEAQEFIEGIVITETETIEYSSNMADSLWSN